MIDSASHSRFRIVYSTRTTPARWEQHGPWHPDRKHVEHWARVLASIAGPVVVEDSDGRRQVVEG